MALSVTYKFELGPVQPLGHDVERFTRQMCYFSILLLLQLIPLPSEFGLCHPRCDPGDGVVSNREVNAGSRLNSRSCHESFSVPKATYNRVPDQTKICDSKNATISIISLCVLNMVNSLNKVFASNQSQQPLLIVKITLLNAIMETLWTIPSIQIE